MRTSAAKSWRKAATEATRGAAAVSTASPRTWARVEAEMPSVDYARVGAMFACLCCKTNVHILALAEAPQMHPRWFVTPSLTFPCTPRNFGNVFRFSLTGL